MLSIQEYFVLLHPISDKRNKKTKFIYKQINKLIRKMRRTILFVIVMITMVPLSSHAQWRVGANVGADYNHYSLNTQYQNDVKYKGRWGLNMGVMGQYDIFDWLGVRAELDWTQKSYRRERMILSDQSYKVTNNYLQLPVMASMSFGSKQWRGFCNLGVYGGYWMNSDMKGTDFNSFTNMVYEFEKKYEFNDDNDNRWDFGYAGGLGVEYRIGQHWAAQMEARYYYSVTSTHKSQIVEDNRYHSTLSLQAGIFYCF